MAKKLGIPKTIVCPVDFSPGSRAALEYAVTLAEKFGASVHVVHSYQLSAYASPSSDLAQDLARQTRAELEGFLAGIGGSVRVTSEVRLGVPYVEIVTVANELEHAIIVMGTTGKTGLEHLLLGSVAERVVRTASVPVVTIRSGADE